MSLMPGSALGELGIVPHPVGTREELEAAGLDPGLVGSCAPNRGGIRGCAHWKDCPFHLMKYNGGKWSKGDGPRNVGYYLQSDDKKAENSVSCFVFVKTLLARMRHGMALREQGKPGELIRIIAQEGEEIFVRRFVKIDENDRRPEAGYKEERLTVLVPKHPRPGELSSVSYDAIMTERERQRQLEDPDFMVVPRLKDQPETEEQEAVEEGEIQPLDDATLGELDIKMEGDDTK